MRRSSADRGRQAPSPFCHAQRRLPLPDRQGNAAYGLLRSWPARYWWQSSAIVRLWPCKLISIAIERMPIDVLHDCRRHETVDRLTARDLVSDVACRHVWRINVQHDDWRRIADA